MSILTIIKFHSLVTNANRNGVGPYSQHISIIFYIVKDVIFFKWGDTAQDLLLKIRFSLSKAWADWTC